MKTLEQRLIEKIHKTSTCWLWIGSQDRNGYGLISVNGKIQFAHRVSWFVFKDEIPVGLKVLHKCDYSHCVRPSHLFLGTQANNVADMIAKGRSNIVSRRILSYAEATAIRTERRKKLTFISKLAARYHVSTRIIRDIINNKTYLREH